MKSLINSLPYSARGIDYEILVYSDGDGYFVAGYRDGEQVTAGYSVSFPTDYDFRTYTGSWAHNHLIASVTNDLDNGRVVE